MNVIAPFPILDAHLVSSNATEPAASGETLWASAGTYALGDRRIRTTTHRIYEALVAHAGRTALPEVDTAYWLDAGPTNLWAMFDLYRNSATVLVSPLTLTLAMARRVNSLALMGMDADAATVQLLVGATVVYSNTQSLILRRTLNATDYCFGEFRYKPSVVLFDLPPITGARIVITLTRGGGGTVRLGAVVVGMQASLGEVDYAPKSEVLNFSPITRDAFGNATLKPLPTVPATSQTLWADKAQVDKLRELRAALNSKPAVYSGMNAMNSDGFFEALLILGAYKTFSIELTSTKRVKVGLDLEEI